MKDISQLYGEAPGSLYEDYIHHQLEEIAEKADDSLLKILEVAERRAIRYYFQHRRGETAFSTAWLPKIESTIAKIEAEMKHRANQRLVIFNNDTGLYWSGMGVFVEPWCKSKARALIFLEKDRERLQEICDRTNKKIGYSRRLVVVQIDATKRLANSKF